MTFQVTPSASYLAHRASSWLLSSAPVSRAVEVATDARSAEARLFGVLVPLDDVPPVEPPRQRSVLPTVAEEPELGPPPELLQPRVVLQARAGHPGGNPVSLTLLGTTGACVDRVEALPLDLLQPPAHDDPALVYGLVGTGDSDGSGTT